MSQIISNHKMSQIIKENADVCMPWHKIFVLIIICTNLFEGCNPQIRNVLGDIALRSLLGNQHLPASNILNAVVGNALFPQNKPPILQQIGDILRPRIKPPSLIERIGDALNPIGKPSLLKQIDHFIHPTKRPLTFLEKIDEILHPTIKPPSIFDKINGILHPTIKPPDYKEMISNILNPPKQLPSLNELIQKVFKTPSKPPDLSETLKTIFPVKPPTIDEILQNIINPLQKMPVSPEANIENRFNAPDIAAKNLNLFGKPTVLSEAIQRIFNPLGKSSGLQHIIEEIFKRPNLSTNILPDNKNSQEKPLNSPNLQEGTLKNDSEVKPTSLSEILQSIFDPLRISPSIIEKIRNGLKPQDIALNISDSRNISSSLAGIGRALNISNILEQIGLLKPGKTPTIIDNIAQLFNRRASNSRVVQQDFTRTNSIPKLSELFNISKAFEFADGKFFDVSIQPQSASMLTLFKQIVNDFIDYIKRKKKEKEKANK